MNSEISNNLALSSVTPVKTEGGPQNVAAHSPAVAKPPVATQPVNNAKNENSQPSAGSIKSAADKSNPFLQSMNLSVEYSVDAATKEMVMKVVDTGTGNVVRQIPSAEMLDFVKRLQEVENKQKGAVIQTRA